MARKMMQKEVTFTVLKIAKMVVKDGKPVIVELPDEVVIGTINPDKAQKLVNKKHQTNVTIFDTVEETKIYQMPVADFIQLASVKGDEETDEDTDEETDEETVNENHEQTQETMQQVASSRFKTF